MTDQYIIPGVLLIAVVMALVEFYKKAGAEGRTLLYLSLVTGMVIGVLHQAMTETPTTWQGWAGAGIYGLVVGLTASGVYDVGKSIAMAAASTVSTYMFTGGQIKIDSGLTSGSSVGNSTENSLALNGRLNEIDEINKRIDEVLKKIEIPSISIPVAPAIPEVTVDPASVLANPPDPERETIPPEPERETIPPEPGLKRSVLFDEAQAFLAARGAINVTPAELERVVREITG